MLKQCTAADSGENLNTIFPSLNVIQLKVFKIADYGGSFHEK
jgi:hypothetical protein